MCPKSICSDTGWIETAYQSIVCLPNQITVRIEGVNNCGSVLSVLVVLPHRNIQRRERGWDFWYSRRGHA
ncbi:NusG domain II-containing protein [Desulfosporosinus lacus]|uniref:NusG domain II-containing protein n=1 Tax=Desulfosporosinus lacus TaxID=329936 RepID=UPI00249DDB2B|nr:NusG domain II-containing protein [Desulfosporosinus lacus]